MDSISIPPWKLYEVQSLHEFLKRNPHTEAYLWEHVPEDWFIESGYIHDFNKKRLTRIFNKKNKIQDFGTDVMYKDEATNSFGFVQCKYYSESTTITSSCLGTFFLMHMVLKRNSLNAKSFLYSPSDNLEIRLRESLQFLADTDIEHVTFSPVLDEKEEIEEIEEKLPILLRNWQVQAIETLDSVDNFSDSELDSDMESDMESELDLELDYDSKSDIKALQAPCGAGKSIVIFNLAKNWCDFEKQEKIIFFVAPLKISVHQLYKQHEQFFSPEKEEKVKFDSDSDATCDISNLYTSSSSSSSSSRTKIVYVTYMSFFDTILPYLKTDTRKAMCIIDECHNLTLAELEKMHEIVEKSKILLVSATVPDTLLEEMCISEKNVFRYSYQQCIEDGFIVSNNYWVPQSLVNENSSTSFTIKNKITFLLNGMLKSGARRCIAFFSSKEECLEFNEKVSDLLEDFYGKSCDAFEIVDGISSKERERRIDLFSADDKEKEFHFLSSVRILQEAVDIPKCDSVFISNVHEKSNEIRLWQSSMRGSRLDSENPCKKNNIFIWIDDDESLAALNLFNKNDPTFTKKLRCVETDYDSKYLVENISEIEKANQKVISRANDNLRYEAVSFEERALESWRIALQYCDKLCAERGIDKSKFKPSNKSKDLEEKRIYNKLSDYRKALKKFGNHVVYESVNDLIKSFGFEHWLLLESAEELALKSWRRYLEYCEQLCVEKRIDKFNFKPSSTSKNLEEKRIGSKLSNYRNALRGKGDQRVYDSVNELIKSYGFENWLSIQTDEEKALKNWRSDLEYCDKFCMERCIEKVYYWPSTTSTDSEEKRIAGKVGSYRKALKGSGKHVVYESVNLLIKSFGFEHFLSLERAEESTLKFWRLDLEYCKNLCEERCINKSKFLPNQKSKDPKEKRIGSKLSRYRQVLKGKISGAVYESVHDLIISFGFEHWLSMDSDEELVLESWKLGLEYCDKLCVEKGIDKSKFQPSTKSTDPEIKRIGSKLSNYRNALRGKGKNVIYKSVDDLIKSFGFEHWLSMESAEEIALKEWQLCLEYCERLCAENGIEKSKYRPSKKSKDSEEKKVGIKLSHYRQAFKGRRENGIVYERVNILIQSFGFEHWLSMESTEEIELKDWRLGLEYCERLCEEKRIDKSEFWPNQKSKDSEEKRIGSKLSNYRQAFKEIRKGVVYESVNLLIQSFGFGHWLSIQTGEEIALKSWRIALEYCDQICLKRGIDKSEFRPSISSKDSEEKNIGTKLNNYRGALKEKGKKGVTHESVNDLIKSFGFGHWLSLKTGEELALESWQIALEYCDRFCMERDIEKSKFRPNKRSKDPEEKNIGTKLQSYCQALRGSSKGVIYKSVNDLIISFGFGHWLSLKTDEELVLEIWQIELQICERLCLEKGIEKSKFRPSISSKDSQEKRIGKHVQHYRQALKKKGSTYESVNDLIISFGFGHWLLIESAEELALEIWRIELEICDRFCLERSIEKSKFWPKRKSKDSEEKKIGHKITNYRQALKGKGTVSVYESVNDLIKSFGFEHWLDVTTVEESVTVGEKRPRSDDYEKDGDDE